MACASVTARVASANAKFGAKVMVPRKRWMASSQVDGRRMNDIVGRNMTWTSVYSGATTKPMSPMSW